MSFLRPEALATLKRWREALIGLGIVLLAVWWGLGAHGFVRGAAIVIGAVGLALLWNGIRRARFQPGTGGTGVVEVDERQITYFGPEGGGAISIDALIQVRIFTTADGPFDDDVFWVLDDESGQHLRIPSSAEGADGLFDALAALPGANYEVVIEAMRSTELAQFDIWKKSPPRLH